MTEKKKIFPLLLVNFMSTLGYGIVIPFLVFVVTKFGGNALLYGILGAVYPAFQLLGAPLLGKWSDIYGRKKILLLSEFGTLISWGIFFLAFFLPLKTLLSFNFFTPESLVITLPLAILFVARAIGGITGGNISVANAYLADITDEKSRSKNFGKLAISANLGFIAGPALSGILGNTSYGELLPISAAFFISLGAVIVISAYLPNIRPNKFRNAFTGETGIHKSLGYENKECFEAKEARTDEKISFKKILKIKHIPIFLLLNFLIFLGFNFFYTAFPVHVVQSLNWTITDMGVFFSILSLIMVIVQGPVLTHASGILSDSRLIQIGSIVLAINFVLLLSTNIVILYSASVLFAIGNGLMWPSFLSLLSKTAGVKNQGAVQGYASSFGSLASIIGLIAGGILYSVMGEMTFLISSLIILIVFLLSFKLTNLK